MTQEVPIDGLIARAGRGHAAHHHAEAERRLAAMKKSGKGIPADEVFERLSARAQGGKTRRPGARALR